MSGAGSAGGARSAGAGLVHSTIETETRPESGVARPATPPAMSPRVAALVPVGRAYLLGMIIHAQLATVRRDNTPQVNPMWFEFDGESILISHTTTRAKYRNLMRNPAYAISLQNPVLIKQRLELRGRLIEVRPDADGAFYMRQAERYQRSNWQTPPADAADRVVMVLSIEHTTIQ